MIYKNIFLLLLFTIYNKISYCDIVPSTSHPIEKCVKIINANDFPDISLLVNIKLPSGKNTEAYIINANECLDKGYKFNSLNILAVKKSYLAKKNLNAIDWLNDTNVLKSNIQIECYGGYESNSNPISFIEELYQIAGYTDTSVILFKCQEVHKFNDGSPNSIEIFSYKTTAEKLNKKDILNEPDSKIENFLKALFFTILIEILVLFIIFKTKLKVLNISSNLLLFTGLLASLSTLPYVWFILPVFFKSTFVFVLVSELSVVIFESIIIYSLLRINYKTAIVVSIICNLASYLFGLFISYM